MNIHFKLVPHSQRPEINIVEVWLADRLLCVIYPEEPSYVRIISRYPMVARREPSDEYPLDSLQIKINPHIT